jgi:hypothetical protein
VPAYAFNHLSNGSQSCAGAPLVLFLGTAWLARLLARWRFEPTPAPAAGGAEQPLILDHFALHLRPTARAAG